MLSVTYEVPPRRLPLRLERTMGLIGGSSGSDGGAGGGGGTTGGGLWRVEGELGWLMGIMYCRLRLYRH